MEMVSTLTHFPLEPGCADYSFLDQAVKNFEHGIDSFLTDSIDTPQWDTSFDEADAIPSSIFSGFLCSVSIISDNSRLMLAPSIKPHKLWCQARALLYLYHKWVTCNPHKLIHYFSSKPARFGFCAASPSDNIMLNPGNKKTDQDLSDFQTGIDAAAYATLDTD